MNTPRAAEWDAFRAGLGLSPLRRSRLTDDELETEHTREAAAPCLGRYGRRLLDEIDSYLEFFAIARAA